MLADGFFLWARLGRGKQPFRVVLADRRPFAFSGLWDRRLGSDGLERRTFTIITAEANQLLKTVSPRMPVILAPADYARWLNRRCTRPGDLTPLLRTHPAEGMAVYPVDALVNDPMHDTSACIAPYPQRRPLAGPRVGQVVRVHHCERAYNLPEGLEPGTTVKLLKWDAGWWTVEADGRRWDVSMTCVNPGEVCYVAGEWLHESHPRVEHELRRLADSMRITDPGDDARDCRRPRLVDCLGCH